MAAGRASAASAETITLEDIAREPYVMLTVDEANQTASQYWKPTGLKPNIVFKTSSVEAVRSMVADGMGITILSDMVYRPWSLEGQRIEQRNVASPIPTMDVGVAWNRSGPGARHQDFPRIPETSPSAAPAGRYDWRISLRSAWQLPEKHRVGHSAAIAT